jgi:flagellar hook-length control protein FliK
VTGGTVQAKAEVGKAPAGTAQPNPLRQVLAQQDLASAGAPEGAPAAWKSADAGTAGTPAASSDSDQSTQSGGERLIHLGAGIAQAGSQTAGTGFSVNATQGKPVAQPALAFDVRSLAGQIVRHAQAWVHEGQTDVRLQLDPPNLGQVEVRLSHQEQGVSITLAAGQANGAQALGSRLDELRQGLVAAGVPLLDLSLEQGQTSWKQAGQGNSERPVGAAQPLPYRANPRGDVASSRGAAPSLGAGALEIWI